MNSLMGFLKKFFEAIFLAFCAVLIILAIPVLLPIILLGNVYGGRVEKKIRHQFIKQYNGKKIGVLAYTDSRVELLEIVKSLEPRLVERLIIRKNGDSLTELEKKMIADYLPDFDAIGPFGDPEEEECCEFIDLRVAMVSPIKAGVSFDLLYHSDKLTETKLKETVDELNGVVAEQVDAWDRFLVVK